VPFLQKTALRLQLCAMTFMGSYLLALTVLFGRWVVRSRGSEANRQRL